MIEVVRTADPFAAAAERAAGVIERIARDEGRVRVAVTGGSAARFVEQAFARLAERDLDPARLLVTWIDERCVPPSSPESNRGTLRGIPDARVVLPLYAEGETPAAAVARVERELIARFEGGLDVALLGIGPDGHVASLFPGRPELAGLAAHVPDSPKPPPSRITLTRAVLASARHVILAARGADKRDALARLVAGDPELPGVGLPGLVVFTDQQVGQESER